ncbi:MAG TPA: SLBB domain-containing protein [Vicinamibacterales bacterium]|nr:SLBB domain-containing protein [Vicinamibacterales bacterium]
MLFQILSLTLVLIGAPSPTAFVEEGRFYVTGHVKTPGSYSMPDAGITVEQAIKLAGGITERGDSSQVKIIRKIDGKSIETPAKLSDSLQANDVVQVLAKVGAEH